MDTEFERLRIAQLQLIADKRALKERIDALERGSLTFWYKERRDGNVTYVLVAALISLAIVAIAAPWLWELREAKRLASHHRGEFFFGPIDYVGILLCIFFLSMVVTIIPVCILVDVIIISKSGNLFLEKQQDIDHLKQEFEKLS